MEPAASEKPEGVVLDDSDPACNVNADERKGEEEEGADLIIPHKQNDRCSDNESTCSDVSLDESFAGEDENGEDNKDTQADKLSKVFQMRNKWKKEVAEKEKEDNSDEESDDEIIKIGNSRSQSRQTRAQAASRRSTIRSRRAARSVSPMVSSLSSSRRASMACGAGPKKPTGGMPRQRRSDPNMLLTGSLSDDSEEDNMNFSWSKPTKDDKVSIRSRRSDPNLALKDDNEGKKKERIPRRRRTNSSTSLSDEEEKGNATIRKRRSDPNLLMDSISSDDNKAQASKRKSDPSLGNSGSLHGRRATLKGGKAAMMADQKSKRRSTRSPMRIPTPSNGKTNGSSRGGGLQRSMTCDGSIPSPKPNNNIPIKTGPPPASRAPARIMRSMSMDPNKTFLPPAPPENNKSTEAKGEEVKRGGGLRIGRSASMSHGRGTALQRTNSLSRMNSFKVKKAQMKQGLTATSKGGGEKAKSGSEKSKGGGEKAKGGGEKESGHSSRCELRYALSQSFCYNNNSISSNHPLMAQNDAKSEEEKVEKDQSTPDGADVAVSTKLKATRTKAKNESLDAKSTHSIKKPDAVNVRKASLARKSSKDTSSSKGEENLRSSSAHARMKWSEMDKNEKRSGHSRKNSKAEELVPTSSSTHSRKATPTRRRRSNPMNLDEPPEKPKKRDSDKSLTPGEVATVGEPEEGASMWAMMKMFKDMQTEMASLRQEVSDLKAERDVFAASAKEVQELRKEVKDLRQLCEFLKPSEDAKTPKKSDLQKSISCLANMGDLPLTTPPKCGVSGSCSNLPCGLPGCGDGDSPVSKKKSLDSLASLGCSLGDLSPFMDTPKSSEIQ